jgi:hypothetical protein
MKRYKQDSVCVKCGQGGSFPYPKSEYWRPSIRMNYASPEAQKYGQIQRTCLNCGYIWQELTLDCKEEP